MRKLLLIRHAKSSHKDADLDDHERPLTKRGESDSLIMARELADKHEPIDVIYSSTATRALDFAQTLSDFCHTSLIPDLSFYTFDEDELLEILRHLPETTYHVAIVAHNPALHLLANRLTNHYFEKFPTASFLSLNCDIEDWSDLTAGSCEIDYFESPKMFR